MKTLIKLLLFLLAAILAGLLVARPAIAESPTIESSVINPPYGPYASELHASPKRQSTNSIRIQNGWHSTRAEKEINPDSLRRYLDNAHIPLASYAEQIVASPYSSTIIGICWIEQHHCTKAPGNNYWGIMCKGKVCRYETLADGIQAISNLLDKYESKGKDTLEELNCYYVQPCSNNWLNTVIKIKQEVESL